MYAALFFALILVLAIFAVPHFASAQYYSGYDKADSSKAVKKAQGKKPPLKISSSAFKHSEMIPKKFTCDGENVSPPLLIENIPQGTKSLALTLDDPDAPKGTFTHWVAWNISPKKTELQTGEKKGITEGANGAGKPGYIGPCPPSGTHRYFFKVYALDTKISLATSSQKKDLESAIKNHIIQSATLIGKYLRS